MKWIIKNIFAVLSNINQSFKLGDGGYSGRKSTAFALLLMLVYCMKYHVNDQNVIEFSVVLLVGILLCLSVVTAENIIKFIASKNGKSTGPTSEN